MIHHKLLAALLTLQPAMASPEPPVIVPMDLAARIKAPNEDPSAVDFVAYINARVNSIIQPVSDMDHYGVVDYWVQYPADNKGDCEDYALTKIGLLGQAGFPIVTDAKLVSVIVHIGNDEEGHEILAVRLPHGTVLYLDNMNSEPMTRKELKAEGYEFFDWKA